MVAFRITGFSGVVPRRGARLLDPNQAQVAVNCRLTSGYIAPLKQPNEINDPGVSAIASIFRMPNSSGTDFWVAWAKDVDAAKGPIAGDITYRTYYTGDNEPRVTDNTIALSAAPYPSACYVLGVYPPDTAPGVSHAGGAGATVSRAFLYTFLTPWSEESQPSPASSATNGRVDGTWTVNTMDTAPANTFAVTGGSWSGGTATLTVASTFGLRVGETVTVTAVNPSGYNAARVKLTAVASGSIGYALAADPGGWVSGGSIARDAPHNTTGMTKNIYWSETDAAGVTTYKYVGNVPVATTSTTIAGNTVSAEELPSTDWNMPPADLTGLVALPGQFMVGFSGGNELCFSEPGYPHAWPTKYRETTNHTIVGLGAFLTSVVVATQGQPVLYTGSDPAAMSPTIIERQWPCLAKRGIANLGFGVAFPVPQGLALIGSAGSDVVTKDLYTLEEWALLNPSTFRAAEFGGRYVASYEAGANNRQVLVIDKAEFASSVSANALVTEFWGDTGTGKLYAVIGDVIHEWDADDGQKMIFDWLSREEVFARPLNLAAAKVDAVFTMTSDEISAASAARAAIVAANAALIAADTVGGELGDDELNGYELNGDAMALVPSISWDSLTYQLYIDGEVKFSKILTDSKPFRLPDGYLADNAAHRVLGNVTVKAIIAASSMKELAAA